MSNIDELINMADKFCKTLEESLEIEKKICQDVSHELEMIAWEMCQTTNNLKRFRENIGG